MGEFATMLDTGERFKIGTCEDLMYLRYDQLGLIGPGEDTVDFPIDEGYRFRFPFPDEDAIEPGEFRDSDRGVIIPRFTITTRWLMDQEIDCDPRKCGGQPVEVVFQRALEGTLWTVVRILPADAKHANLDSALLRLPLAQAAQAAECFASDADRVLRLLGETLLGRRHCRFQTEMGRRILAGYDTGGE